MNPPKQSFTTITIVLREETPKIPEISTTIEVDLAAPVQQIVSEICQRYDLEDWNYALYSSYRHIWLQNERPLSDYSMACVQRLFLSTKKPAYFETESNNTMHSPTGRSVLRAMSSGISALLAKKGSPFRTTLQLQRHSIYLATILFNADKQILLTKNGQIPTLPIVERDPVNFVKFEESSDDFAWVMKKSMSWTEERRPSGLNSELFTEATLPGNDILMEMSEDDEEEGAQQKSRSSTPGFRRSIGNVFKLMRAELGIKELGFLHDDIVELPEQKVKFIITYNFVPKSLLQTIAPEYIQRGILRWNLAEKLDKLYTQSTVADIWRKPYRFYSSRKFKTGGGLYLGLFYAESKVDRINVLLPRGRKNFLPAVRIRQESDMTDIEWNWVRSIACCDKQNSAKNQSKTSSGEQPKLSAAKHRRLNSKGSDYNVEDFKQSFQQAFDMLQERTQLSFENKDIFGEGTAILTSSTINRDTVAVISEESQIGSATLDQRSSELENSESEKGSRLYTHPNIRIIWIVKPMKNLMTSTDNVPFNEKDYYFYPFHIFDILHHSLYNSAVYAPLRKVMLALQESHASIREDLEEAGASSLEKLFSHDPLDSFAPQKSVIIKQYQEQLHREQLQHELLTPPHTPELASSLLPFSTSLVDAPVMVEPKTLDESLAIISDEMQVVTSEWGSISYTHHLMQFDRQRNFRRSHSEGVGNKWSSWELEAVLAMIHKSQTRIMKKIKAVTMQQETERVNIGLERKMVQLAEKDIAKLKVSKDKEGARFSSLSGLTRR